MKLNRICVYCGSSTGSDPGYLQAAQLLGLELAKREIGLVYGGASVGLMGSLADTILGYGGEVIGVIPKSLVDKEVSHGGLTKLIVVDSMHERKALMADFSDGFIAMPGGFGTVEELFEVLTWSQLGFHEKPCALLNSKGYYSDLLAFLSTCVAEQFIKEVHREMLLVSESPDLLIDLMLDYQSPKVTKWIRKNEL